ncbi:hypothetical protein G7Y79_00009g026610 [Physcia stellaris]|nr:hypothetical protein G7Y79_00009g026610 [Physcia stellaris]
MADEQGASPRELLLEASRRNNTSLLSEVFHSQSSTQIAKLLNESTDGLGNYCLHIAASYGSYQLLDQEGLEVDPIDRLEGDTPLHKAVRFINGLPKQEWEAGSSIVDLLIDAGADPRIRNKAKLKPMELADPRNIDLRASLQKAEFTMMAGDDVVDHDAEDDGPTGSASDSE